MATSEAWTICGQETNGVIREWAEVAFAPAELQPDRYFVLRWKPRQLALNEADGYRYWALVTNLTSVTFSATVAGTAPITFQWRKDGAAIAGATASSFTIASVQVADGGVYTVVATNATGTATSNTAALIVTAPAVNPPAFAAQPLAQTVAPGSTVVFSASAEGATAFQWRRNDAAIPGATRALLVLAPATAADAGSYSVLASNSGGATPSAAAALTVSTVPPADTGRLINLSILTPLAAGETMTMGTVLGGAGTSGTKALLARAAGPSLAPLGVADVLPDPTMSLVAAGATTPLATNDDWRGAPALSSAFTQVGAFAYASSTSKDAAIFQSALQPGGYTVAVSAAGGAAGSVIAELYDSTPTAAFTAATPRLVNVSVLKSIATGATLTAGFVIGGTTSRTVLVRAIGPGLAALGVGGVMPDPRLTLSGVTASNDNWGGDPQLTAAANAVGAFALSDPTSRDAVLLVTLPPGQYTAQVSGIGAGGTAIVEVYEVP